jgi:uncharacterized metal-binding protein YceD (DUF177 family)
VKRSKEYVLTFADLKIGEHRFDYHVDNAFFETFPESEILAADVNVSLVLDKQENMLALFFDVEGAVSVTCDRCLDEFPFLVETEEKLLVKFGTAYKELDDDLIVLPSKTHSIDLQQHIYEYIMLALPMQRIHPDLPDGTSGCNQTMLKQLKKINTNQKADPRWDVLRKLINNCL